MLLIDAMMLTHRCYAKMDFLKNSKGQPTGLEFGMLRTIESLVKHWPGQQVCLCWESHGRERRQAMSLRYKANRTPPPSEFFERLKTLREFLRCFWLDADADGYEADDVMFALSRSLTGPHFVYTNDDDLLQVVDDTLGVVVVKSFQSKLFEWNEAKVREKYDCSPWLLPKLRAFIGDASDNLPGVERINKKYIASLITWCDIQHLTDGQMLHEVLTGDWTDVERERLKAFIESGTWYQNYEMMRLCLTECHLRQPVLREDFIVSCLQSWEIRTLKLCEPFKSALAKGLDTDEF